MRHTLVVTSVLMAAVFVTRPAAAQEREITPGREVTATLGLPGDPTRSGRPYQVWTFRADSTMTAQFFMRSTAFDAVLVLQDSAGGFLDVNDNSGGGRDARVTHDVRAGARYRLVARSQIDTVGAYTLAVRKLEPSVEGIIGPIARGQDLTGSIAAGGPTVSGGRPYRAYLFDGRAGDSITIDLTSDAFDTFLIVQDAAGRDLADNDDFGDGLNSHLVFVVPATARYRIVATVFDAGATGTYRLRVR